MNTEMISRDVREGSEVFKESSGTSQPSRPSRDTHHVVYYKTFPVHFVRNAFGWHWSVVPLDMASRFDTADEAKSRVRQTTLPLLDVTVKTLEES